MSKVPTIIFIKTQTDPSIQTHHHNHKNNKNKNKNSSITPQVRTGISSKPKQEVNSKICSPYESKQPVNSKQYSNEDKLRLVLRPPRKNDDPTTKRLQTKAQKGKIINKGIKLSKPNILKYVVPYIKGVNPVISSLNRDLDIDLDAVVRTRSAAQFHEHDNTPRMTSSKSLKTKTSTSAKTGPG